MCPARCNAVCLSHKSVQTRKARSSSLLESIQMSSPDSSETWFEKLARRRKRVSSCIEKLAYRISDRLKEHI
jgi:hypothetical protein